MAAHQVHIFKAISCLNSVSKCFPRYLQILAHSDITFTKPLPYDYMKFGYGHLHMFDNTSHRFTENTKFVSVEGNVASGKGHVSKKISEYFGMILVEDPTDNDIYILKNYDPPIDIRMHNTLLPKKAQYYTTKMFWNEENLLQNGKPMFLQYQFYLNRYWNYLKGLCHLFNTGRGCVSDRSHFTDLVFAEALLKCGYISEYAYDWFAYMHTETCLNLWKPHLIVYVKATNEQIREALKKSGMIEELNARNMTDTFLKEYTIALESFLEKMSRYSHIFVLDRKYTDIFNEDDIQIFAEKLTAIDLEGERLIRDDYKYLEWRNGLHNERSCTYYRKHFSCAISKFSSVFSKFRFPLDMTEAGYTYDDREMQHVIYKLDPRMKYSPGYNPSTNSLMKIMFNPFVDKRNFEVDWPKHFLTHY